MDTQTLKNFIKIADAKSITGAARQIYISQPSLSNQLKALEKELGTTLVVRTSRRLELTEAGELLYKYAKQVVDAEGELMSALRSESSEPGGTLKVGIFPSASMIFLGERLGSYLNSHRHMNVEFHEAEPSTLQILLEAKAIDLAIVRLPFAHNEGLEMVHEFEREPLVALDCSQIEQREVDFTALCSEQLLVTRRFKTAIQNEATRIGRGVDIRISSTYILTLISLAEQGLGTAIVPAVYCSYADRCGLRCRHIRGLDNITARIGVLKRRTEKLPSPVAEFLDIISLAIDEARQAGINLMRE